MTKILEQPVDRYPLAWPDGWPRTPAAQRQRAPFHRITSEWRGDAQTGYNSKTKRQLTLAGAVEQLVGEVERLRATRPVLSTNVELRLDGQPKGDGRPTNGDPGAAIYFLHKNRPIVFACDKWDRVADNISAIARHIESIRAQDRWGVGRLEQALAGYQKLLSGRRAWFEVLGLSVVPVEWRVVQDAYDRLKVKLHPDVATGDTAKFQELQEAFETAREEFGR